MVYLFLDLGEKEMRKIAWRYLYLYVAFVLYIYRKNVS